MVEVGFAEQAGPLALLVQRTDRTEQRLTEHEQSLDRHDTRLDAVERGDGLADHEIDHRRAGGFPVPNTNRSPQDRERRAVLASAAAGGTSAAPPAQPWTPPVGPDTACEQAGIAWDAVRAPEHLGVPARELLGAATGAVIRDPYRGDLYWLLPVGATATWTPSACPARPVRSTRLPPRASGGAGNTSTGSGVTSHWRPSTHGERSWATAPTPRLPAGTTGSRCGASYCPSGRG